MSEILLSPEQRISEVERLVVKTPEIAGIQNYEYLRSNVNSQKQAFIEDGNIVLQPSYPVLGAEHIIDLAGVTEQALKTLMPTRNEKADALFSAVEYRFTEMFLLRVAGEMNDGSLTDKERQEAEDWFKLTSEALYGKPDKEVFAGLARYNLTVCLEKPLTDEQPKALELQAELKDLFGQVPETSYIPFRPEQTTVDRINELITERLGFMVDHVDEEKLYEVQDMVEAINVALGKIGGVDIGWISRVVKDSAALSVLAHKRLVEVGENRDPAEGSELRGKILHEVGVHALRSINAKNAGWLSAAYGQEGYLDFEEAFATALEDAYQGKFEDHGIDYYLIAGLTYGQDNHAPRAMREVYEIMWRKGALQATTEGADLTDAAISKAQSEAFTACVRMFRGTSTTSPGVIYLKDLAYFNGQERAWSVLANVHSQQDLDPLFAGKLDLTIPYHQHIAKQILSV